MKVFGFALLCFLAHPPLAKALDHLEKLRQEHIQKLKEYQEKNPGWNSAPSDEYVAFFKKWNDESLEMTLRYHQERCQKDKAQCLSAQQERDLKSQYKVASETIERQNREAKTSTGELVTKPGTFGGNRAPAENNKTPPSVPPEIPEVDVGNSEGYRAENNNSQAPLKEEGNKVTLNKPTENKPTENKPTENKPTENKPTENKPTENKPTENKPTDEKKEESVDKKDEEVKEEAPDDKSSEVKEEVKEDEKKDEDVSQEELEQFNDEEFPKNYDPKTCEWVEDMPRKIVYGPSFCSRQAVQICTGYVVCERKEGGGKFVRMSSCSPKNCGRSKEAAIACTLEQAYYSRRPEDERNHFVSPELKKILSSPKVRAQ